MPKQQKPTRDITARGTPRKMSLFVHWTQKRGAKAKLAKASARRRKTIAQKFYGSVG